MFEEYTKGSTEVEADLVWGVHLTRLGSKVLGTSLCMTFWLAVCDVVEKKRRKEAEEYTGPMITCLN